MAESYESTDAGRNQLGSFLTRAAVALGEVKNAIVRSSQIGKIKLDSNFLRRERDLLLRDLGQRVVELAEDGSLELPEALAPITERVRQLDRELLEQELELVEVERESRPDHDPERERSAWAEAGTPRAEDLEPAKTTP